MNEARLSNDAPQSGPTRAVARPYSTVNPLFLLSSHPSMDAIPTETHAAELSATTDDLERGLTEVPLSKGINRIDDWRREITATEREDLAPIASALEELRDSLVGEERDVAKISGLLVRLGEMTEASAEGTAAGTQTRLKRLGSVLRHAGSALAG